MGGGFDAALDFNFIFDELGFLRVIRNRVEWWYQNIQEVFCRLQPFRNMQFIVDYSQHTCTTALANHIAGEQSGVAVTAPVDRLI